MSKTNSSTSPTKTTAKGGKKNAGKRAKRGEFGALKAIYKGRAPSVRDWLLIFLPLVVLVLVTLGYGAWLAYTGFTRYGPVAALSWPRPWLLTGTLCLILLGAILLYSWYLSKWKVSIFEKGLIIQHPPFKLQRIPWSKVNGIAYCTTEDRLLGFSLRIITKAILFPTLGKPVSLDCRIKRLPALIDHIEAYLFPILWNAYREAFLAGQTQYFGRLAISKSSLAIHKQVYSWEEIDRLRVDSGNLVIELSGAHPLRVPIMDITNLELLLQLVEQEIKL